MEIFGQILSYLFLFDSNFLHRACPINLSNSAAALRSGLNNIAVAYKKKYSNLTSFGICAEICLR